MNPFVGMAMGQSERRVFCKPMSHNKQKRINGVYKNGYSEIDSRELLALVHISPFVEQYVFAQTTRVCWQYVNVCHKTKIDDA